MMRVKVIELAALGVKSMRVGIIGLKATHVEAMAVKVVVGN